MRRTFAVFLASSLIVVAMVSRAASSDSANWAVNAAESGPSLPPSGRSLFDHLVSDGRGGYDLPFPLTALLQQIARRARCPSAEHGAYKECYRAVLIPLGRSLQRNAVRDAVSTAPSEDFFRYPRAVFAVVDDAASTPAAPLMKDRLYLGYHESAEVVEVISYNEAAGRFEFQVVKGYRAGAKPEVVYANRAVCVACHQNHAPLFSRQVWDETNANPAIARRLLATGRDFYGVRVDRGVDVPQAIDNAVNRANFFAAHQLLWQQGCGADDFPARRCRAAVLIAALQYALSGELGYDSTDPGWREGFDQSFEDNWRERWPHGLALPNAGLPNRDPLQGERAAILTHVPAKFDPLQPRSYSVLWQKNNAQRELIAGVAATFTRADVTAVNNALARRRGAAPMRAYTQRCTITRQVRRVVFDCPGSEMHLRGSLSRGVGKVWVGSVDFLHLPDGTRLPMLQMHELKAGGARGHSAALLRDGLPARTPQGQLLARFGLRELDSAQAVATVEVIDDFSGLRAPLARATADASDATFANRPFSRPALLAALGRAGNFALPAPCCVDDRAMAPAQTAALPAADPQAAKRAELAPFFRYCATCHQSNDRSPPNFLHPAGASAAQGLKQCAPRIYYRLAMWQQAPQLRKKTPMPPEIALRGLYAHADWPHSTELNAMKSYAAHAIENFDERALLVQPYESLRSCLPARVERGAQQ